MYEKILNPRERKKNIHGAGFEYIRAAEEGAGPSSHDCDRAIKRETCKNKIAAPGSRTRDLHMHSSGSCH